jgi:AraC-like DNA-binding protein
MRAPQVDTLGDPDTDIRIPSSRLRRLLATAASHDIEAARLLEGTGLAADDLVDGSLPRIQRSIEIRALDNALAAGLPQEAALDSAEASLIDYGVLGYAMMSCATLDRALRIAMRYYRTGGPLVALHYRVERDEAVLEAEDELGLGPLLSWVVESMFAPFPGLLRELLGHPVRITEVCFTGPPVAHRARLEALFRAPVRFHAFADQFRFDAAQLARPLVRADAWSASLFERSCRELLTELEGETSFASRLSRDLLAHPGEMPGAGDMARRLNMSERTLRRRLASQGTSWQAVVDRVRKRIAEDYLCTTSLSIQEIAELLGYTEATNFRRAFLKWTGRTPVARRRAARPPDWRPE